MHESGDRGADQQRRRGRADDGLPPAGPPGGYRALEMLQGPVGGFEVPHGTEQHPAQGYLVQLAAGAGAAGAGASGTRAGATGPEKVGERTGGFSGVSPVGGAALVRLSGRALLARSALTARTVRSVRLLRIGVRSLLRPVVHNSVSRRVILVPVLVLVAGPAHVWASITTRSAAIPREPYALTEPSETPSVSATWASVMSAK